MPGLEPRNNSPPCPEANGGQIGSVLRFNLFCGSTIEGETLDTLDAESFDQCVEFCANFHPRCDAVTFSSADRCRLKANIIPEETRPSRFVDGAAALYPQLPPSSCTNGRQSMGGGDFDVQCGRVVNQGDMVQRHHQTMADCAADCASTSGCVAFSFDPSLDRGFMNCYLKDTIGADAVVPLTGIDTGILNAAVPGFNTVPERQTTSGGFFFTPSQVAVGTGLSTRTLVSLSTSASSVISVTQVVTVPVTSFSPVGTSGAESQNSGGNGGENMAWVAAPVVGGIAAVLVVVVFFVMFRKKRRNGGNIGGGEKTGNFVSRMGFVAKSKMPDLSGAGGMLGFWKPKNAGAERLGSSGSGSTPRYEIKGGKTVTREGSQRERPMTGLFRSSDS